MDNNELPQPVNLDVSMVMVPLPAQGHLNQFFHLSRLLAACGLSVHYVGSATHNRQVRDRATSCADASHDNGTIQFHDMPLPPFASPPPNPHAANKFPTQLQPAFDAALHLQTPLAALVRSLASSSRRVVIVHDTTMTFAAGVAASLPNVEAFSFCPVSAMAVFFYLWESQGKPANPAIDELNLPDISTEGTGTEEFWNFLNRQKQFGVVDSGRLWNTCRAIEGRLLDMLAQEHGQHQKTFAIGPLNPIVMNKSSGGQRHECLEWLDKQPSASVVYVSFGSACSQTDEQVAELAAGLEASGQRFLWVLRDADRADIYAVEGENKVSHGRLPPDYLKRIDGFGMVVTSWAPQLEILAHPSTGGFMSHCGWNSCMESISMGVPILAWPMHSDQPLNTLLVADVLGVGLVVRHWAKKDEIVSRTVVRVSVLRLLASEEGKVVSRRARELGLEVRNSAMDAGASKKDLDAFVLYITRRE